MLFCLLISVLFVVRAFMEVVAKNSVNGDLSFDHSWPQILIAINYDKVWSPCDGVERVCLMAEEVITILFFFLKSADILVVKLSRRLMISPGMAHSGGDQPLFM